MESYFSDFLGHVDEGDFEAANTDLMKELANAVVHKREDFVTLLNETGVPASESMSDLEIINLFTENIGTNKELTLGAALLINRNNKQSGFNGDELSNEGVKFAYYVMKDNFTADADFFSNAGGPISAIAQGVGQIAGFGTKIAEGQQKKKFGAQDIAAKKADARSEMGKQILAQRQVQMEAAQKKSERSQQTKKIVIISSSIIAGLIVIGGIIYFIKTRKK